MRLFVSRNASAYYLLYVRNGSRSFRPRATPGGTLHGVRVRHGGAAPGGYSYSTLTAATCLYNVRRAPSTWKAVRPHRGTLRTIWTKFASTQKRGERIFGGCVVARTHRPKGYP